MIYVSLPEKRARIWGSLPGPDGSTPVGEIWWIHHGEDGASSSLEGEDGTRTTVADLVMSGRLPGGRRYPLLLKTLHTADELSVQVHPGMNGGGLFKEETWMVLRAVEGAWMMGGMEPVGRKVFMEAMSAGRAGEVLRKISLRSGDVYHIPPGTVHALGPGLTVLEIQSNCDVTYRIHDWGRLGLEGKPRKLDLKEAADAMDWDVPAAPIPVGRNWNIDVDDFARYSIKAVSGKKRVRLPDGAVLFVFRGSAGIDDEAPVCFIADGDGGEVDVNGRGFVFEPGGNHER